MRESCFLGKLLSPHHSVDYSGVALDYFDDFIGNIFVGVVWNGDSAAVLLVFHHFDCGIDCLQKSESIDS